MYIYAVLARIHGSVLQQFRYDLDMTCSMVNLPGSVYALYGTCDKLSLPDLGKDIVVGACLHPKGNVEIGFDEYVTFANAVKLFDFSWATGNVYLCA